MNTQSDTISYQLGPFLIQSPHKVNLEVGDGYCIASFKPSELEEFDWGEGESLQEASRAQGVEGPQGQPGTEGRMRFVGIQRPVLGSNSQTNLQLNPECDEKCGNRPSQLSTCDDGKMRCLNCRARWAAGKRAGRRAPGKKARPGQTGQRPRLTDAQFRRILSKCLSRKEAMRKTKMTDGGIFYRCRRLDITTPWARGPR